jgi:hypothetical protein
MRIGMCWACGRGVLMPRRWVSRCIQSWTIEHKWFFDLASQSLLHQVLSFLFYYELTPRQEIDWASAETEEEKNMVFDRIRDRMVW